MTISPIEEVRRQHVFIEAWLSDAGVHDDGWRHFQEALAREFSIVTPAGSVVSRAELLDGFADARGIMPKLKIEIRNASLIRIADDFAVVRYEEWQFHPALGNQRVSTAVFVQEVSAPLGWSWLALHETSLGDAVSRS